MLRNEGKKKTTLEGSFFVVFDLRSAALWLDQNGRPRKWTVGQPAVDDDESGIFGSIVGGGDGGSIVAGRLLPGDVAAQQESDNGPEQS